MTLRKLRVLVQNLPPGSALHRAAAGHDWTTTNYQLANVQDGLAQVARTVAQSVSTKTVPQIKPAKRPGVKDDGQVGDVEGIPQEDVLAYLDSLKPKGG